MTLSFYGLMFLLCLLAAAVGRMQWEHVEEFFLTGDLPTVDTIMLVTCLLLGMLGCLLQLYAYTELPASSISARLIIYSFPGWILGLASGVCSGEMTRISDKVWLRLNQHSRYN